MTIQPTLGNWEMRYVLVVVLCIGLVRHPRHAVVGIAPVQRENSTVTATSCAGTLISRFAVAVVG